MKIILSLLLIGMFASLISYADALEMADFEKFLPSPIYVEDYKVLNNYVGQAFIGTIYYDDKPFEAEISKISDAYLPQYEKEFQNDARSSLKFSDDIEIFQVKCIQGWTDDQTRGIICLKDNNSIILTSTYDVVPLMTKMLEGVYGNSNVQGGGCLIATATFGSELAPQVQQLRELRDNTLLQTKSGTTFMEAFNDVYYSFSPVIADYERENPIFKETVKIVITPLISSLSILNYVDMNSEESVLGYGISLIILNGMMYVGIPASVIIGIRRIF